MGLFYHFVFSLFILKNMLLLKPFWVTFLLSLNWIALSNCVKFTLPAYPPGYSINKRCLGLYIQPNTLVTGYINVTRSATDPFFRTNAWVRATVSRKRAKNVARTMATMMVTHSFLVSRVD